MVNLWFHWFDNFNLLYAQLKQVLQANSELNYATDLVIVKVSPKSLTVFLALMSCFGRVIFLMGLSSNPS